MPFSGFAVVCSCFIGSVIFQAKISKICWFQLLKYSDLLLFFVMCDSKWRVFGLLVGWLLWALGNCDEYFSQLFYILYWMIHWLIIRIFISCSSKADRWVIVSEFQVFLGTQWLPSDNNLAKLFRQSLPFSCTVNSLQSDEMCEWSCSWEMMSMTSAYARREIQKKQNKARSLDHRWWWMLVSGVQQF